MTRKGDHTCCNVSKVTFKSLLIPHCPVTQEDQMNHLHRNDFVTRTVTWHALYRNMARSVPYNMARSVCRECICIHTTERCTHTCYVAILLIGSSKYFNTVKSACSLRGMTTLEHLYTIPCLYVNLNVLKCF